MRVRRLAAVVLGMSVAACALVRNDSSSPSAVPEILQSGFLSDYTDLVTTDEPGRATFVYRAVNADLRAYHKILLDHVTLWRESARGFGEIPDDELDRLAIRLFSDLWDALDDDYQMVAKPGPGVLRVAVAITDVGHANAPMDIYSADVDARDRVEHSTGALGDPVRAFLANASLEIELTDAESRRVLAAALDRRLAERVEDGRFDDWSEVEWGFDAWARLLATRLREAKRSPAPAPK